MAWTEEEAISSLAAEEMDWTEECGNATIWNNKTLNLHNSKENYKKCLRQLMFNVGNDFKEKKELTI